MFFDEVVLQLKAGNGGNGAVSFRREKFVPDGGPDGGTGGRGGDIIIKANNSTTSLIDFKKKRIFQAQNGKSGHGANKTGKSGDNLILFVPIGTQVYDETTNELIVDLDQDQKEYLVLKGGDGGLGNSSFKTSVNQAPRKFQNGFPGQEGKVKLIHKMFCDVGIIGKPNAGKSTFLSTVTNARPKIGDYPFTTLSPNLGVIDLKYDVLVIADIPGLIEGASLGHGLGDKFLKHIERCKVLLHLIDISSDDIVNEYRVIRKEIKAYDKIIKDEFNLDDNFVKIFDKPQIVCLNKCDLISDDEIQVKLKTFKQKTKITPYLLSSFDNNKVYQKNKSIVLNKLIDIKSNLTKK
mgnify:CR=1 FL=1